MKGRSGGHFVLVTSGLGSGQGGIGVVSDMIVSAMTPDFRVSLWRHPIGLPRLMRTAILATRAGLGAAKRPDFIFYEHLHLAAVHTVVPGLAALPYGIFLHGIEAWTPLVGRRREGLLRANILLANSQTTVEKARSANPWLPEVKIVALGVPCHGQQAIPGDRPSHAVTVGRIVSTERLKGHDLVLDAWPLIVAAVPRARLTVVGSGDDVERLKKRVLAEKLEGVEFAGWISDRLRDEIYLRSRLLFYLSQQEGFGLAAIEAAASGTPVLGLAGTVMEELFPSGHGAVLVSNVHPKSIAEAAIPILTQPAWANSLGRAARERVQACFTDENFKARFRTALSPFLV